MTDLLFNQFSVNFFQERYSECLVSLDEDCLQLLNKVNDDLVIENENTFSPIAISICRFGSNLFYYN